MSTYFVLPVILLLATFSLNTFWVNLAFVRCALRTEYQCLPPDPSQHFSPVEAQRMRYHAGRTALGRGEVTHAITWLEQAVRSDASDTSSSFYLGMAYRQNGDEAHAIKQWQAINAAVYFVHQGRINQAVGDFRTALAIDPSNAEAWQRLGDLLWIQGNYAAAVDAYRTLLQISAPSKSQQLLAEGRIAEHTQAWAQAISVYEQAAHNDSASLEPCLRLSDLYQHALHRPDLALEWLQEAIRREPGYIWAYQSISDIYISTGDLVRAADWATSTVTRFPTNAFPRLQQGIIASLQGDHNQALEAFTHAEEIDPGNFWPAYYRGTEQLTLGHVQAAIKDFRQAVQLAPQNPTPLRGLADAYWQAGQSEDAVASYRRLLELVPNDPWATQQINKASQ